MAAELGWQARGRLRDRALRRVRVVRWLCSRLRRGLDRLVGCAGWPMAGLLGCRGNEWRLLWLLGWLTGCGWLRELGLGGGHGRGQLCLQSSRSGQRGLLRARHAAHAGSCAGPWLLRARSRLVASQTARSQPPLGQCSVWGLTGCVAAPSARCCCAMAPGSSDCGTLSCPILRSARSQMLLAAYPLTRLAGPKIEPPKVGTALSRQGGPAGGSRCRHARVSVWAGPSAARCVRV